MLAAMSVTVELPRVGGPGSGLGGPWKVVVLNDDHNTFDHVAETLARVLPGVALADGYRFADRIHNAGLSIVWSGPREAAEDYWDRLGGACLTMAPREAGEELQLSARGAVRAPGAAQESDAVGER